MKFGKKEGDGIFYYIDGRIYKGKWHNDLINGFGV
jgi:hypothetical protein